jgi:uncharacterized protein YaiI (UPF0178 family)
MKIWVDADACPSVVKDILCRAAERIKRETIFVANSGLRLPISDFVRFIQVPHGADIADDYIVEHCTASDLVITADIPLAVRIVAAGAVGLDPRGTLYDKNNIGYISSVRDFMHTLRSDGVVTGGPKDFNKRDTQNFASAFDRFLTKSL